MHMDLCMRRISHDMLLSMSPPYVICRAGHDYNDSKTRSPERVELFHSVQTSTHPLVSCRVSRVVRVASSVVGGEMHVDGEV